MRTDIEFAVHCLGSKTIIPVCSQSAANRMRDNFLKNRIPAMVVCRRITYGAWTKPRLELLSRG
jgi:hypothetical protein